MIGHRERWIGLVNSSVQFALAFTLAFLVHELGLVVPARLMGAEGAILFHNNMTFRMTDPAQTVAFGIGPLAALTLGGIAWAAFLALPGLTKAWRRFLLWLAVHGVILCVGQAPAVAHAPDGDLARALYFFEWSPVFYRLIGIGGLLGLVAVGYFLGRGFLSALAPATADLSSRAGRLRWLAFAILLPGLVGAVLCFPFRFPPLERAVLPFTTILGTGWSLLAALPARPQGSAFAEPETRWGWGWFAAFAALLVAVRALLVPGAPIG
jgi:hypothetical protein